MIQAKDLRLGNIVSHTDDEGTWIMTIETVTLEGCHTECNGIFDYIEPELLEPIPLTEEWLIKFGFGKRHSFLKENDKKVFDYRINDYSVTLNRWVLDDKISFWVLDTCINDENIKYVHQLQNLYFALTGEELTTI